MTGSESFSDLATRVFALDGWRKPKHARIIIKGGAVKKKKIFDSLGASL